MTRERRRELAREYRKAAIGATKPARRRAWLKFLAALWKEDNDPMIFGALRTLPRKRGALLDWDLLNKKIDPAGYLRAIRNVCGNSYVRGLNRYGIANIDMSSPRYRSLLRNQLLRQLQGFDGVDPSDKTAVCTAMARTWHRWVREIHSEYGLPSPRVLRRALREESDAEVAVMDSNDFDIPMTPEQEREWEKFLR